ncbi:unnamed protein product [Amoebophrya sp. A25]|nr:unnamed protein product [Amoebophrya sp. A25]|eukprot:GSA25T00027527001.1
MKMPRDEGEDRSKTHRQSLNSSECAAATYFVDMWTKNGNEREKLKYNNIDVASPFCTDLALKGEKIVIESSGSDVQEQKVLCAEAMDVVTQHNLLEDGLPLPTDADSPGEGPLGALWWTWESIRVLLSAEFFHRDIRPENFLKHRSSTSASDPFWIVAGVPRRACWSVVVVGWLERKAIHRPIIFIFFADPHGHAHPLGLIIWREETLSAGRAQSLTRLHQTTSATICQAFLLCEYRKAGEILVKAMKACPDSVLLNMAKEVQAVETRWIIFKWLKYFPPADAVEITKAGELLKKALREAMGLSNEEGQSEEAKQQELQARARLQAVEATKLKPLPHAGTKSEPISAINLLAQILVGNPWNLERNTSDGRNGYGPDKFYNWQKVDEKDSIYTVACAKIYRQSS